MVLGTVAVDCAHRRPLLHWRPVQAGRAPSTAGGRRMIRTASMPVFVALLKPDDHGASHEERDPCRSQRQRFVHFRREQSCANRRTQDKGRDERRRSPEKAMTHD
jgi:hypothetical protein